MTLEERIMLAYAKTRRLSEEQADMARQEIARMVRDMTLAGKIDRSVVEKK